MGGFLVFLSLEALVWLIPAVAWLAKKASFPSIGFVWSRYIDCASLCNRPSAPATEKAIAPFG
jgi:hypothetical protein